MSADSVGKIGLDLEINSNISGQLGQIAKGITSSLKAEINSAVKSAFADLKGVTKNSMSGVDKAVKDTADTASQTVKKTVSSINNDLKSTISESISAAKKAGGIKTGRNRSGRNRSADDTLTTKYNRQIEAVKKAQLEVDKLTAKYEQMLSGQTKPTSLKSAESELKKLQAEIKKTEQEYDKAFNKMQSAQQSASMDKAAYGSVSPTTASTIRIIEADLDRLGAKLSESDDKAKILSNTISQIKMNPDSSVETGELSAKLDFATDKLSRLKQEAQSTESQLKGVSKTTGRFSSVLGALKKGIGLAGSGIKKLGGFFSSLISKLKQTIFHSNKTKRSFNGLHGSSNKLGSSIFRLGKMFQLMVLRKAINATITGIKEGFENLAQYSDKTNASISSLMSALTQLKNSLATAFAPILNVVAPILTKFINLLSEAFTRIGMLFASLTGQSSFTKAVPVTEDYAASLGNAADSANNATGATKEYQKSLMGFDSVNKLSSQSNSSSPGDTGASGYKGPSVSEMFETVPINNSISDLADKIKEAWKKADFTEIGTILGQKLNDALNSINWDKIQATINKVAKSVATFLNGFIKETDWGLVGYSFGQGINTILGFIPL